MEASQLKEKISEVEKGRMDFIEEPNEKQSYWLKQDSQEWSMQNIAN